MGGLNSANVNIISKFYISNKLFVLYKDLENKTLKGSSSAHDTDREARSMARAIQVMRL
jgi:hypothetical protein